MPSSSAYSSATEQAAKLRRDAEMAAVIAFIKEQK